MKLRLSLACAILLALLSPPIRAATPMLLGPALAVTDASNATPIVVTTAANGAAVNDYVWIQGVTPSAVNGIWKCSAVAGGNTCTLTGSTAAGAFVSGGTLRLLGVLTTGASPWYDCARCSKASVFVYSMSASPAVATVTVEGTSRPTADATVGVPPAPPATLVTITNPDNGTPGNGYYVPAISSDFLRVNVTAWTSGPISAILTCETINGDRRW